MPLLSQTPRYLSHSSPKPPSEVRRAASQQSPPPLPPSSSSVVVVEVVGSVVVGEVVGSVVVVMVVVGEVVSTVVVGDVVSTVVVGDVVSTVVVGDVVDCPVVDCPEVDCLVVVREGVDASEVSETPPVLPLVAAVGAELVLDWEAANGAVSTWGGRGKDSICKILDNIGAGNEYRLLRSEFPHQSQAEEQQRGSRPGRHRRRLCLVGSRGKVNK